MAKFEKPYTVHEVSQLLRMSERLVRYHLAQGNIKGSKIGPKVWRIPYDEVQRLCVANLKTKEAEK